MVCPLYGVDFIVIRNFMVYIYNHSDIFFIRDSVQVDEIWWRQWRIVIWVDIFIKYSFAGAGPRYIFMVPV